MSVHNAEHEKPKSLLQKMLPWGVGFIVLSFLLSHLWAILYFLTPFDLGSGIFSYAPIVLGVLYWLSVFFVALFVIVVVIKKLLGKK